MVSVMTLRRRLHSWFPEREFFMRSQGQVRFITLSSRLQMIAAGVVIAALLGWAGSLGAMAWSGYSGAADRDRLAQREAQVASSEQHIRAHGKGIQALGQDLEKRQDLLEDMVASLPQDAKASPPVAAEASAATDAAKISAMPDGSHFAAIERRQAKLAERLTRFADQRAARAEAALRELGLDPRAIADAGREAMGGPLQRFTGITGTGDDDRFARLEQSFARMNALVQGLERVPQVLPASLAAISSGFGYRLDPFTRAPAMHAGLDFRGPIGAPVHAAARGRVSFVGWHSGYGNTVEISHGDGLLTRYAHMSRLDARVGESVTAGKVIGAIGNSGRSTGPHLHFEVRHHGRALNPRLFLERAPDVLEEIRRPALRTAR